MFLVRSQLSADVDYDEEMKPGRKTQKCIELINKVPETDKIIVFSEFLGMDYALLLAAICYLHPCLHRHDECDW
ncbi:MAG: hypothetical protein EOP45_10765 [Sphingobacteriaceae bacterium]|nr:MAG: hypothetical protein EOP45_10765 [Sphingobacteriaceae bacterium]